MGTAEPVDGSGPDVEKTFGLGKFVGCDRVEVGALGVGISDQAVGVLVRSALPRRVRIAEVDNAAGLDGEGGVLSTSAGRQGVPRAATDGSCGVATRTWERGSCALSAAPSRPSVPAAAHPCPGRKVCHLQKLAARMSEAVCTSLNALSRGRRC